MVKPRNLIYSRHGPERSTRSGTHHDASSARHRTPAALSDSDFPPLHGTTSTRGQHNSDVPSLQGTTSTHDSPDQTKEAFIRLLSWALALCGLPALSTQETIAISDVPRRLYGYDWFTTPSFRKAIFVLYGEFHGDSTLSSAFQVIPGFFTILREHTNIAFRAPPPPAPSPHASVHAPPALSPSTAPEDIFTEVFPDSSFEEARLAHCRRQKTYSSVTTQQDAPALPMSQQVDNLLSSLTVDDALPLATFQSLFTHFWSKLSTSDRNKIQIASVLNVGPRAHAAQSARVDREATTTVSSPPNAQSPRTVRGTKATVLLCQVPDSGLHQIGHRLDGKDLVMKLVKTTAFLDTNLQAFQKPLNAITKASWSRRDTILITCAAPITLAQRQLLSVATERVFKLEDGAVSVQNRPTTSLLKFVNVPCRDELNQLYEPDQIIKDLQAHSRWGRIQLHRPPKWVKSKSQTNIGSLGVLLVEFIDTKSGANADWLVGLPVCINGKNIKSRRWHLKDVTPQCSHCWRWGHTTKSCNAHAPTCAKCAGPHTALSHLSNCATCTKKTPCALERCINCLGTAEPPHAANSRSCPFFKIRYSPDSVRSLYSASADARRDTQNTLGIRMTQGVINSRV
ncbi:hypothetical protein APHAL10511_008437 [Amanita phalloides]|nr:hypothetical protein APHAL10511_008437 [Amanita phalloides]